MGDEWGKGQARKGRESKGDKKRPEAWKRARDLFFWAEGGESRQQLWRALS